MTHIPTHTSTLPPIAKATITWLPGMPELLPGQQTNMKPVTVAAYGHDGLPILLTDEQQLQVLDAYIDRTQPHLTAAVEGFAEVASLLAHGYKALHEPQPDGSVATRCDDAGEPLVSPGWSRITAEYLGVPAPGVVPDPVEPQEG